MDDWGSGFPSGADLNGNGKFDPADIEIWHDIEKGSKRSPESTRANYGSNNNSLAITGIVWLDVLIWIVLIGFAILMLIVCIGLSFLFPPLGVMLLVTIGKSFKNCYEVTVVKRKSHFNKLFLLTDTISPRIS